MQRQSLGGSPGSKQHGGSSKEENKVQQEEHRRKEVGVVDQEEEKKTEKLLYHRNEKSIHLIPILTLFCFLVLYLCSHDPSQTDLNHVNGFGNQIDSIEIDNLHKLNGDVLAVRSHRSLLKHGNKVRKSRYPRKIGDF